MRINNVNKNPVVKKRFFFHVILNYFIYYTLFQDQRKAGGLAGIENILCRLALSRQERPWSP